MSVDFEKCFDTIEFVAIRGAMQYFGIGPKFIEMVMLLYKNFETAICHNGYLSEWYKPERGCHQGCSISGYLFLLNTEVLAHQIIQNREIKGVMVGPNEEKVSQFVDDMNLTIMNDHQSLQSSINALEDFKNNTGLGANFQKTTIFRVGISKNIPKPVTNKSFNWSDANINVLGITLDDTEQQHSSLKALMGKMKVITRMWSQRGLSLIGKIVIANTLIGSMLVYRMQVLPTISKNDAYQINQILQDFIWSGRKPKIRIDILQSLKCDGGMRLFDPMAKDMALKIEWVKRLQNNSDDTASRLAYHAIKPNINNQEFWYLNFHESDIQHVCKGMNNFWMDVIKAWSKFNFHEVNDIPTLLKQRLWFNSHIRRNGRPFIIQNMYAVGIVEFYDIINLANDDALYLGRD